MIHIGQRSQPLDHQFERKPGFDHWTLGLMLSGSSYMQYANEEIRKLAHCITLTPPDTPYRARFGGQGKTWFEMWAIFPASPAFHSLATQLIPSNHVALYLPLTHETTGNLKSQFELLSSYDRVGVADTNQLIEHGLAGILLTLRSLTSQQTDSRLREAASILSAELDQGMALNDVARRVGMSPSSLSHRFKESYDCTPMHYREAQRLKQAASLLLATDLPLKEVAAQFGFADAFHFSRRFRNHFELSPSQYRKDNET